MSRQLVGIFSVMMLMLASTGNAAELDANQKKYLAEAQKHLKQFQTNLKLAQDAAGTGEGQPPASKARLAATRLGQANQSKANCEAYLEKLPADNAEVKDVQSALDASAAEAKALEDRLRGKGGKPDGAKPAGEMALDYRQRESLKNANYHITTLQGQAAALEEFVQKVNTAPDKTALDHAEVSRGMNTVDSARITATNAEKQLEGLPDNGQGVKAARDALTSALSSIDKSEAALKPVHAELMKLVDPSSHGDLEADIKRMQEMAQAYGNMDRFQTDRPQVVVLVTERPAVQEEIDALGKKYAALLQQQTEQTQRLKGAAGYLAEKLKAFDDRCAQEKVTLPPQIDDDLQKVSDLADEAVKEQKPAFFGGGIPQFMGSAEEKAALYAALDPEGAKAVQAKLASTRDAIKQREASLTDAIINANEPPKDNYTGADKDDLKQRAIEAWKKIEPNAEVLAVAFPSQQWKREVIWRRQNREWYRIDRSKLQAQLIVKRDDKLAAVRAINLWTDHMSNDEITANPLDDKDDPIIPQNLLLLSKVK